MDFGHKPVLLKECIEYLNIKKDGIYVDGTLGGAGHSKEIANRLGSKGLLIGVDQDKNAINAAAVLLKPFDSQIKLIHNNFKNLNEILKELEINSIDGLLLDLGVSSHQLDEAERGFSYMQDAPLDMRMDTRNTIDAKQIVNQYSAEELEKIIRDYGEEKWAKRIVQFILKYRQEREINTTLQLVEIIKKAIPAGARKEGPHPAKRTFQAIRIEVNQELNIIEETVRTASELLNPGGRICIITFHSLEDRIVKNIYKELSNPCICPPQFPVCKCSKKAVLKVVTKKPVIPAEAEIELNHRARSAKLRVSEKI